MGSTLDQAMDDFRQSDLEKERSASPVPTSASFSSEHSFEDSGGLVVAADTTTVTVAGKEKNGYEHADFCLNPPPLRRNAWQEADATTFHVRTQNYLKDSIKAPSKQSMLDLLTVDLVKTSQPLNQTGGLCSHPTERIQQALAREKATPGHKELPAFIFCVNLCIPTKQAGTFYHWAAYFGTDNVSQLRDPTTPLGRVAEPFFFGDCDEYRNKTFKLIPRIVKGNFVVRKAVGSKPSILGNKLKHYYHRSDRFLELIVDIGSEKVANRIVKLALGYAKTLVVDMMFLLEGQHEETLPERILGGVRLSELDFKHKDGQRFCPSP